MSTQLPTASEIYAISLQEIAMVTGAILRGDPNRKITSLCAADEPFQNALTFISGNPTSNQIKMLAGADIGGLLIEKEPAQAAATLNLLICKDAFGAMLKIVPLLSPKEQLSNGISPLASIDPSAKIGKDVSIGAFCVIGPEVAIGDGLQLHSHVTLYSKVSIGKHTVLHSGVSIREMCSIGNHCLIHNGAVIGADGFGFVPDAQTGLRKVPQIGNVLVEDSVEIGANSCVDRATFGTTLIGHGSKLDNFVQIGHNVKLGRHCILCAHAKIGGSTRLGNGVVIAGGASVADHIEIADGVRVGGHSGVAFNLLEKGDYFGLPAIKAREYHRNQIAIRKLAHIRNKKRT